MYDGGQLTGEVDANGVMIRRYVPLPGPDETLAMYDSTGVSYPLADSRGTPMAWALANGQVAVQGYGAFGEEGGSNIGRFGFTGQMRLPEIGLDYYKARFYDPQIGRFMTPDPAGMVDGPNLYAYVLNDPINFTDPSGLFLMCDSEGRCVETEDIVIVAPSPFTGVAFDHPPSNGNGQLNNTGRGSGTLAAPPMMMMGDTIRPLTPLECVATFAEADGAVGAALQGAAAIGAGADIFPKLLVSDRLGIGGGGRSGARTSVISAVARGFVGRRTMDVGAFGTRSVGGALGRGLSRASIIGGLALEAKSLFSVANAARDCNP